MRYCIASLVVLLFTTVAQAEIRLIGPDQVEVDQAFEVSVEGLHLDLSIFVEGGIPPQVEWRIIPKNGSIHSRMEVLIVIDETTRKPKWVISPYATVTLDKPGKVGVTLMVVQEGVGLLLVHEVTCGPFPNPIPPPPDEELYGAVIIEETSQRTPELAAILASSVVSSFCEKSGLDLFVADQHVTDEMGQPPARLVPYIDVAKELGMPCLFIMGRQGATFYEGKVPKTPAAFIELVKQYAKGDD